MARSKGASLLKGGRRPAPPPQGGGKWSPTDDNVLLQSRETGIAYKLIGNTLHRTALACRLRVYHLNQKDMARRKTNGVTKRRARNHVHSHGSAPGASGAEKRVLLPKESTWSAARKNELAAEARANGHVLVAANEYEASQGLMSLSSGVSNMSLGGSQWASVNSNPLPSPPNELRRHKVAGELAAVSSSSTTESES